MNVTPRILLCRVLTIFILIFGIYAEELVLDLDPTTTVQLGQAFDATKGKFLFTNFYGVIPGNTWENATLVDNQFRYNYDFYKATSQSEVYNQIDIAAEIKVGFVVPGVGGVLNIAAKGKFSIKQRDFNENTYQFFQLNFKSQRHFIDDRLTVKPSPDRLNRVKSQGATHYVKNVIYGGDFLAEISYKKSEELDIFILELSAALKYTHPAFPGGIAAAGGFTMTDTEKKLADDLTITIYAQPGPIEAPISLVTLIKYLEKYAEFLRDDPKGSVLGVTLGDLSDLSSTGIREEIYWLPSTFQIDALTNMFNDLSVARALTIRKAQDIDKYKTLLNQDPALEMLVALATSMNFALDKMSQNIAGLNLREPTVDMTSSLTIHSKTGANWPCASGQNRFSYELHNLLGDIKTCLTLDYRGTGKPFCNGNGICRIASKSTTCTSSLVFCECSHGWYGETCSWHACDGVVNDRQKGPCRNNPYRCNRKFAAPGYDCSCRTPYNGDTCTQGICEQRNPCQNNGGCTNLLTYPYFKCDCSTTYGFLGATCAVHYCEAHEACGNRGTCVPTQDTLGYTCECRAGYTGVICQTDICSNDMPCNENAVCVMDSTKSEGYRCDCKVNFVGEHCTTHRICDDADNNPCENGSTCNPIKTAPFYKCDCFLPWYGDRCNTEICTYFKQSSEYDPCAGMSADCMSLTPEQILDPRTGDMRQMRISDVVTVKPQPSFSDLRGIAYRCDCQKGWFGEGCTRSICDWKDPLVNPCGGRGECQPRLDLNTYPNGYKCKCSFGFRNEPNEQNCALSICDWNNGYDNPCFFKPGCKPRGDLELGFICEECGPGFYGEFCTKHLCDNKHDPICKHGGMCNIDSNDRGFSCTCLDGLGGPTCEEDLVHPI